jgi:hypothetical protein
MSYSFYNNTPFDDAYHYYNYISDRYDDILYFNKLEYRMGVYKPLPSTSLTVKNSLNTGNLVSQTTSVDYTLTVNTANLTDQLFVGNTLIVGTDSKIDWPLFTNTPFAPTNQTFYDPATQTLISPNLHITNFHFTTPVSLDFYKITGFPSGSFVLQSTADPVLSKLNDNAKSADDLAIVFITEAVIYDALVIANLFKNDWVRKKLGSMFGTEANRYSAI